MEEHFKYLQSVIDERIGPAAAMGFTIGEYDGESITLNAPLAKNRNHHGTGFGGSLYSIAAVASWALVFTKMKEHNVDGTIVVSDASIKYERPVTGDFSIRCFGEHPEALDGFVEHFRESANSRATVIGEIYNKGKRAVRFEGIFSIKG